MILERNIYTMFLVIAVSVLLIILLIGGYFAYSTLSTVTPNAAVKDQTASAATDAHAAAAERGRASDGDGHARGRVAGARRGHGRACCAGR